MVVNVYLTIIEDLQDVLTRAWDIGLQKVRFLVLSARMGAGINNIHVHVHACTHLHTHAHTHTSALHGPGFGSKPAARGPLHNFAGRAWAEKKLNTLSLGLV